MLLVECSIMIIIREMALHVCTIDVSNDDELLTLRRLLPVNYSSSHNLPVFFGLNN